MDALLFERAVEAVIAALERWHLPEPNCRTIELCALEDATLNNLLTLRRVLRFETNAVEETRHSVASNAVLVLGRLIEAEKANTPAWRALRIAFDSVMDQRAYRVRWPISAEDHEFLAHENARTQLGLSYAGFVERTQLDAVLLQRLRDAAAAFVAAAWPADGPIEPERPTKPKRSTERGEGRAKLIAALTEHHQYAAGGCLNTEPASNNGLARAAGVSPSTASMFFWDHFDGHTKYKALCRQPWKLAAALKLLNDEFAPRHFFGLKNCT